MHLEWVEGVALGRTAQIQAEASGRIAAMRESIEEVGDPAHAQRLAAAGSESGFL